MVDIERTFIVTTKAHALFTARDLEDRLWGVPVLEVSELVIDNSSDRNVSNG